MEQFLDRVREAELVQRWSGIRDDSESRVDAAALLKHAGAKAAHALDAIGEVKLLVLQEALALLLGEHFEDESFGILGRELAELRLLEHTIVSDHRGRAGRHMEV